MAKKKKEMSDPNPSSNSESSTVFKTLFGEIAEENPTFSSLFSENNPFRRKPQESKSQEPPHELDSGSGEKGNDEGAALRISDSSELTEKKKRKKEREKNEALDVDLELSAKTKKSKNDQGKESEKNDITNVGENVNRKDGVSGVENENKKKKRKRDELELEYEAKKYGVAVEQQEKENNNNNNNNVVGEKRKKIDTPEDMMVSKEGFDDEDKLLRTVFVGNLPLKIKKKALIKEFAKFGEVESVRIRSVPIIDSKVPRKGAVIRKQINENGDSVHAYVVFKTEDCAQASLANNMAIIEGNHIRVDRACPPRKKLKGDSSPLYDNKRTVFVGNLPFDVKDEEIYQLFSGVKNLEDSVEAVRVVRDPGTSLGKGIAYILFKTREAANSMLKKHNLKLRDRELRLSHAKPNSTPAKRNNQTYATPAKKASIDSRNPGSDSKVKAKANTSYQGMRASKSGSQKKFTSRVNTAPAKSTSGSSSEKPTKEKRPAVAARKLKAQRAAANSAKQGGKKRKLDSRTPASGGQKKKARKFR